MSAAPAESITAQPRKRRRIFMWVFLAVQALFLVWVIAGIGTGADNTTDAENVGTGIGVALIIGLWFFVDLFLGVAYGVYRLARHKD